QPVPEFAQRRELRDAEQAEGVTMRCVALERADDEGTSETLADPHGLGAVEVAAASARNCAQPFQFLLVGLPEPVSREPASVVNSPQDHQCAHLEAPREAIERTAQFFAPLILRPQ